MSGKQVGIVFWRFPSGTLRLFVVFFKFTRFQRNPFDFLSSRGTQTSSTAGKSKENLWKRVNLNNTAKSERVPDGNRQKTIPNCFPDIVAHSRMKIDVSSRWTRTLYQLVTVTSACTYMPGTRSTIRVILRPNLKSSDTRLHNARKRTSLTQQRAGGVSAAKLQMGASGS